jgi:hypothetical protein
MPEYEGEKDSHNYMTDSADRSVVSEKQKGLDIDESKNDTNPSLERKVIRNAMLEIASDDAKGFYGKVVNTGNGLGGYEYSYNINHYDTYTVIVALFKIPPEKLSSFIKYIEENSDVFYSSMNADDITESYYDSRTRLESKRKSLEQYYTLLKSAKTIEDIVYIQKIIDGITEEIEALEGRLRVWDSQSEMATVSLNITQYDEPIEPKKEIVWDALSLEDMGYLMKSGLYSGANAIYSLVQWVIIIVVGYALYWIPLLVLVVFLRKLNRKNAIKRAERKEARIAAHLAKRAEREGKVDKISDKKEDSKKPTPLK